MMNSLRTLFLILVTGFCAHGVAKDVKDTLFSPSGDRIIVNYSIQHNGGQIGRASCRERVYACV